MARYTYDAKGRLRSYSRSQKEQDEHSDGQMALVLILIAFAPLLYTVYRAYHVLYNGAHMHPVFAGLAVGVPSTAVFWLMAKYRLLRRLYFISVSLGYAYVAFLFVAVKFDIVWGYTAGLAVAVIGVLLGWHFSRDQGADLDGAS